MMGQIPSEGGYQATIFSDLKRLQDRLYSNANGSITSIQTIYIPADDLTDPAVQEISSQIDSVIVLSAPWPSRHPPRCRPHQNQLLTHHARNRGDRHYLLVTQVQAIMQKYDSLKNIIAIIGENELSPRPRRLPKSQETHRILRPKHVRHRALKRHTWPILLPRANSFRH